MNIKKSAILKQKINSAIDIMNSGGMSFICNGNKRTFFPNCYSFYVATNENLSYMQDIPSFEGKDVLTVTASGDHALNAIYLGAKSVETFDINALSFLAYDLKQTALLHLSRNEFLEFYKPGDHFFKENLYKKVSPYLNEETKIFFDSIFEYVKNQTNRRFTLLAGLIEQSSAVSKNLLQNNPYLATKAAYNQTQQRLSCLKTPVKHKLCPAHKIGECFKPKDMVILSNILPYYFSSDYSDDEYSIKNNKEKTATTFVSSLNQVLKEDGVVSLLYEFCDIHYKKILSDRLGIDSKRVPVQSMEHDWKTDSVYVAEKKDVQKATQGKSF